MSRCLCLHLLSSASRRCSLSVRVVRSALSPSHSCCRDEQRCCSVTHSAERKRRRSVTAHQQLEERAFGSLCSWLVASCCCCCWVKAPCSRLISSSYLAAVVLQCSSSVRTLPKSTCRAAISRTRSTVAASTACRRTRIWRQRHDLYG